MEIKYDFVPEYKLEEEKYKKCVASYAGKLLEICQAHSLIVYLDNDDRPSVLMSCGRLTDAFDVEFETY